MHFNNYELFDSNDHLLFYISVVQRSYAQNHSTAECAAKQTGAGPTSVAILIYANATMAAW